MEKHDKKHTVCFLQQQAFSSSSESLRKRMMLRAEQKSVELMMGQVSKICKAEDLVLDTFASSLAISKASLHLTYHRRFVSCEKDSACFQNTLPSLVEVYAK